MNSPPVETVRVNENCKRHLSTLKRRTGIQNWNVICRWAFSVSIADPTPPQKIDKGDWSNVEMSWATFGGSEADLYATLLKARCYEDGLELNPLELAEQFRLHLHRGITKLVGHQDTRSLIGLLELSVS